MDDPLRVLNNETPAPTHAYTAGAIENKQKGEGARFIDVTLVSLDPKLIVLLSETLTSLRDRIEAEIIVDWRTERTVRCKPLP